MKLPRNSKGEQISIHENQIPTCSHGRLVLRTAQKSEKNKGRQFYTCPKSDKSCKSFVWLDDLEKKLGLRRTDAGPSSPPATNSMSLSEMHSTLQLNESAINSFKSQGLKLYTNCEIVVIR
jgi:hypothetical protein